MSAEALAAILAIPPAIEASKNLISSLMGQLRNGDSDDARLIDEKLTEISANIVHFTEFTETLRKWKEVHNVTQIVLFSDLPLTISLVASSPDAFANAVSRQLKAIKRELDHLLRGRLGAVVLINTLAPVDFEVDGLPEEIAISGQTWGEYIKNLGSRANQAFNSRDFGTLYTIVQKLSTDCTVLNIVADKKLKDGLSEITRVMHDVRLKINSGNISATLR